MPKTPKPPAKEPQRIGIPEAARRCGVHPLTFRRWVAAGRIKAVRVGPRLLMVDAADVEKLMTPIND